MSDSTSGEGPQPAAWRRQQRAIVAVTVALALAIAACGALLLASPTQLHHVHWPGIPPLTALFGVLLFLLAIELRRGRSFAWRWRLIASLPLFAVWASSRVLTMGDGYWWRLAIENGTVSASEPGSSLLYLLVSRAFGAASIEWISPVLGWLATFCWLTCTERSFGRGQPRAIAHARRVAGSMWVGSGVCAIFFHGYVEHTQLGMPFFLLALGNLSTWWENGTAGRPRRALLVGTAQLAIAGATHMQYAGMAVCVLAGVLALAALRDGRRALLDLGAVAIVAAGVCGAIVAALAASGLRVAAANVSGGANDVLLVPLVAADGTWCGDGALLSPDHLALVANVLLFAVPMALPWAAFVLWQLATRRPFAPIQVVALVASVVYTGFVTLVEFDLGWPLDLDLMVTSCPGLLLLVTGGAIAASANRSARWRVATFALLAACALSTWCLIAPLVRPREQSLGQSNGPRASLLVNGIGAGTGPFHLRVDRDAPGVQLEILGPPGAPFAVFRGEARPGQGAHPYGGVADIHFDWQEPLANVVCHGALDAHGRAAAVFQVLPLANGELPAIQALVGQRTKWTLEQATAAFYFEYR